MGVIRQGGGDEALGRNQVTSTLALVCANVRSSWNTSSNSVFRSV